MRNHIIDDPSDPALNGRFAPGTVSFVNYFAESRPLWESVEIAITLRCSMACSHCMSESHPGRHEVMSWTVLTGILNSLCVLGRTRFVCFFGGEPTLELPLLAFGIRQCRRLGLVPSVVTAGDWIRSQERTREVLDVLKPVDSLLISTDIPHTKFLGTSMAVEAVKAARSRGINTSVCYTATREEFCGERNLPPCLVKGCGEVGAGIVVVPTTDGGRASRHPETIVPIEPDAPCGRLSIPVFSPTGSIYACGPGWMVPKSGESRLVIGRFPEDTLDDVLERHEGSRLLSLIRTKGPIEAIRGRSANACTEGGVKSPCEACRLLAGITPPGVPFADL